MSRLDTYRMALRVADPTVTRDALCRTLDSQDRDFAAFVLAHGLGPLWHERTRRDEFRDSRMAAEALFLVQQAALREIDSALTAAGVDHAVIKGAANRLSLYQPPSLRACYDLDVLVRRQDKLRAVAALMAAGFVPSPEAASISREVVLRGRRVDVDLHWGLLRDGRLRVDPTPGMLARRRRVEGLWVLADDDALFVLLVHPAFAKHLDGYQMGLHRVVDVLEWLRQRPPDWKAVRMRLAEGGVQTAAWATLRWVDLLAGEQAPGRPGSMLDDLQPGAVRRAWLDSWLRADRSARTAGMRWLRLLAFSSLLHDTPRDALRAYVGRRRAGRRSEADLKAFAGLLDK